MIDAARKQPGSLNFASPGTGTVSFMVGEEISRRSGINAVHLAFKGGGPAMIDLLAGNINLIFATAASAVSYIKAGKINALAITTLKRSALLPDLPALDELGLTGYDLPTWYGLVVPAAVPRPIINQLHAATVKAMGTTDSKAAITKLGMDTQVTSPEQFAAYMRSQMASIAKLGQASGIKFVE